MSYILVLVKVVGPHRRDIGPNRRKYKPKKCLHSILGIVYTAASMIDYIGKPTHK